MAEITSSNPIGHLLDGLQTHREIIKANGQINSGRWVKHKRGHSIPQGKALGHKLTEYGKLKIMVQKLNESDVQPLLEKITSLNEYYFVRSD